VGESESEEGVSVPTSWDETHGIDASSTWATEQGVTTEQAESLRPEILEFLADSSRRMAYLMTRRRDGGEIMRPVATFVEDWTVGTLTQDVQPKTGHVRRDPVVGFLWVGRESRADGAGATSAWNPPVVWMRGRAELIEDQRVVSAFVERRAAAIGHSRNHRAEDDLFLIRVTPEYVRAEGWAGMHAIVYRDFPAVARVR
jgi:hypothetical protein